MKIIALVALVVAAPVAAHDWYAGQRNEQKQLCCGGQDCGAVPGARVQKTDEGYNLWITPGTHPMVEGEGPPQMFQFFGNPGLSPDGEVHACIIYSDVARRRVRCLFIGGLS